jgi:hypothetical protein
LWSQQGQIIRNRILEFVKRADLDKKTSLYSGGGVRTESLFKKLKVEAEEGPIPTPPGDEPPATSDEHTAPAGDLHSVEPVHEPELEASEDEELPPELACLLPEEPPEPRGSVYPQPVAISLNAEEEEKHGNTTRAL